MRTATAALRRWLSVARSGGRPTRVDRFKQRFLARLRGRLDLEGLVADGLQLGEVSFIANDVYLDPGHPWLITIGDGTTLSPGVVVMAHDASMRLHTGHTLIAPVVIGKRVFVGTRAIILPGTNIGDDAVVGAGAVVKGEVPSGSVVVGNPAKIVTDVKSFAERHRAAARQAPVWPHAGWMRGRGITDERMRAQRQALANERVGYLIGSEIIGSEGEPNAGPKRS